MVKRAAACYTTKQAAIGLPPSGTINTWKGKGRRAFPFGILLFERGAGEEAFGRQNPLDLVKVNAAVLDCVVKPALEEEKRRFRSI